MSKKIIKCVLMMSLIILSLLSTITTYPLLEKKSKDYNGSGECNKNIKEVLKENNFNETRDYHTRGLLYPRTNASGIEIIKHLLSERQRKWIENISREKYIEGFFFPHKPIAINDDNDFTGPLGFLPNVRNGVITGKGTKENPYIIEGWRINANKKHGIYIGNTTAYCIVKNCYIYNEGEGNGIYLYNAKNIEIQNITLMSNYRGVYLKKCNYNVILKNQINTNGYGILIEESSNNNIIDNSIFSNYYGIVLQNSSHNILKENTMEENMRNFMLMGSYESHFDNEINSSNTANGKPLLYFIGKENLILDSIDAGFLGFVSCNNITLRNVSISYSGNGVLIYQSNYFLIEGNAFYQNDYAISLQQSSYNTIRENYIESSEIGVHVSDVFNSLMEDNILNEDSVGIMMAYSSNNIIISNNISKAVYGVYLSESTGNNISKNDIEAVGIDKSLWAEAISLENSPENTILNNILSGGWDGIYLVGTSPKEIIDDNVITQSGTGIAIWSKESSDNIIRKNIIDRNIFQALYITSNNNSIEENVLTNHTGSDGIALLIDFSSNNTLRRNHMYDNQWAFEIIGDDLSHFIHDIDTSNTINGKPIYYFIKRDSFTFENPKVGMIGLVDCKNVSIANVSIAHNGQGVLLAYSTDCAISNCYICSSQFGIDMLSSHKISIYSNVFLENSIDIQMINSSHNTISNTNFQNWGEILGMVSSNNIIEENANASIIMIESSNYNLIAKNRDCKISAGGYSIIRENIIYKLTDPHVSIQVAMEIGGNSNIVENNTIKNCDIGIRVGGSRNNIFRNNIIDNNSNYGIEIRPYTSQAVFVNNSITNNGWAYQLEGAGVKCTEGDISDIHFHYNNICENRRGFYVSKCSRYIDATKNWWGDESGPFDPSPLPPDFNPHGRGDGVTDWVEYRPWLTEI